MENTEKFVNHYGKWIGSETPVTGVISNNSVEWLNDECDSGIDLHYEEYEEEKESESENKLAEFLENNPDLTEEDYEEDEEEDYYEDDSPVYLIGDWKKVNGKYEVDKEGESGFSAITSYDGFNCTQVLWSKWTKKGALCSPCFPGQVDLDSEGDFLAYTLPSDLIGFEEEE